MVPLLYSMLRGRGRRDAWSMEHRGGMHIRKSLDERISLRKLEIRSNLIQLTLSLYSSTLPLYSSHTCRRRLKSSRLYTSNQCLFHLFCTMALYFGRWGKCACF